jgi:hypothetical protein
VWGEQGALPLDPAGNLFGKRFLDFQKPFKKIFAKSVAVLF